MPRIPRARVPSVGIRTPAIRTPSPRVGRLGDSSRKAAKLGGKVQPSTSKPSTARAKKK
jgi:hypothetical protein